MKNLLTLDIEDWYQSSLAILDREKGPVPPGPGVVSNTRRLLTLLREHRARATCFVLGTVAETYPELVREIRDGGHEVATHGYGHELVYTLTPEAFSEDLARSQEILQKITGEPVLGYRAPYFSLTRKSRWALDVLARHGLRYDSSIFPIRRGLYGDPSSDRFPHPIRNGQRTLWELPISTFSLLGQNFPLGGGGYFRLFPYACFRRGIQSVNRQGHPFIFYLHPYELDVDELKQPLPQETLKTRLVRHTQAINRHTTEGKLKRLLGDFEWISIREWMEAEGFFSASADDSPGPFDGNRLRSPSFSNR